MSFAAATVVLLGTGCQPNNVVVQNSSVPYTPEEHQRAIFNCLKNVVSDVKMDDGVISYTFTDKATLHKFEAAEKTCDESLSAKLPNPQNIDHMILEKDRLEQIEDCINSAGFSTDSVPSRGELSEQWEEFGASLWEPYKHVPDQEIENLVEMCDNKVYRPEILTARQFGGS